MVEYPLIPRFLAVALSSVTVTILYSIFYYTSVEVFTGSSTGSIARGSKQLHADYVLQGQSREADGRHSLIVPYHYGDRDAFVGGRDPSRLGVKDKDKVRAARVRGLYDGNPRHVVDSYPDGRGKVFLGL